MEHIDIDRLFENQKRSRFFAVVRAFGDDKELVLVTPVRRRMPCACNGSILVPRTAIKHLTETRGKVRCGNRTLRVVEIEFSEEKSLTYRDLYQRMRAAYAAGFRDAAARPRRKKCGCRGGSGPTAYLERLHFEEGADQGEAGGDGGGDSVDDGGDWGDWNDPGWGGDDTGVDSSPNDPGAPDTNDGPQYWDSPISVLRMYGCMRYLIDQSDQEDLSPEARLRRYWLILTSCIEGNWPV